MQEFSYLAPLLNLIGLSAISQEFVQKLADIVIATSLEREVNTILCTEYNNELTSSDILNALSIRLAQPVLHLDSSPPIERYKEKFNTELLTIAKLSGHIEWDERLLITLWKRLWLNTQSRLILVLTDAASEEYVTKILRMCLGNRAMNVIALQPFMSVVERSYWTVRIFPTQTVIKANFSANYRNIFHEHIKKMHGHPLRADTTESHYSQIYNYTNEVGSTALSGFYGRSLAEYAYRHNATLEFPISSTSSENLTISELRDNRMRDTIDVAPLRVMHALGQSFNLSVLCDYTSLCLMVPLGQPLPRSTFYYKIIYKSVVILLCASIILISLFLAFMSRWQNPEHQVEIMGFFGNISVIQGLFGTPFWTQRNISAVHKITCCTISMAGIIFGTAYNAYLQSFSVNAPHAAAVSTIEDVLSQGVQILVGKNFAFWINDRPDFLKYEQNFTKVSSYTELQLLQGSFDKRYAFMINEMWSIYDTQQKYFSQPILRLSDICIFKNLPSMLPLQENSLYSESLAEFLLRLKEAGLIDYWRRHTFVELLALNWITLEDKNKDPGFVPLKLEDLRVVFVVIGVLFILSIGCFVLEILWGRVLKRSRFMAWAKKNIIQINM